MSSGEHRPRKARSDEHGSVAGRAVPQGTAGVSQLEFANKIISAYEGGATASQVYSRLAGQRLSLGGDGEGAGKLLLYHGTSEPAAKKIIAEGIRPRGSHEGNWSIKSDRSRVYLTECYATSFADHASRQGNRWALVEIDADLLDVGLLLPDEDYLEQITQGGDTVAGDMEQRTAYYRERAEDYFYFWAESLKTLGCVAYAGVVPPAALTRVAYFAPSDSAYKFLNHLDAAVSPIAHAICGDVHRAITRWMFGGSVTCSQFSGLRDEVIDGYPGYRGNLTEWLNRREGIEVVELRSLRR